MGVSGGPDITTDGLVLALDAGSTKSYPGSGNTWYDLSGLNNHASLKVTTPFNSNGYFEYSGAGQNVETTVATVEVNTNSSEGNTIVQWIWQTSRDGSGNMPFTFYDVSWDLWAYNNYFGINNASSLVYGITNADDVLIGKWAHVVVYFPNNWSTSYPNAKMWINGVPQSMALRNGSFSSKTISSSQTVGIGGGYTNGGDAFNWNGRIATTQIYARELNHSEALQNYNATKSRFI
jgi:hypothetical protein